MQESWQHRKASPHGRSADTHPSGNRRFAEACGSEPLHLLSVTAHNGWTPMAGPAPPGVGNPGFDPFPEELALKLGKNREQPSQGSSDRGSQI